MKQLMILTVMLIGLASCTKPTTAWLQHSAYHQYVILNNGDTVTYSDGFVFGGITNGYTKRKLSTEEQLQLMAMLDTTCDQSLADKWKRNFPKQNLGFMMKFQQHTIDAKYSNLTVEDVKVIAVKYYDCTQQMVYSADKRCYYEEFE
jgi:hypothetical protein